MITENRHTPEKCLNILLVEDDAEIADWLADRIEQNREIASFTWNASISEAQVSLMRMIPDLIILDLKLPDGNGIEILKTIKHRQLSVKVIIFSINTGMKNACLRLGAHAFFDKIGGGDDLMMEVKNSFY